MSATENCEKLISKLSVFTENARQRFAQGLVIEEDTKGLVAECCDVFAGLCVAEEDAVNRHMKQRMQDGMKLLYYVEQGVCANRIVKNMLASDAETSTVEISPEDLAAGLAVFCKMDLEYDVNKFQSLLLFLLNSLQMRGYKRYGLDCYEQLTTDGGHNTCAWRLVCSIRDFVYTAARKETNFDQWLNLTQNKNNAASAADYLVSCRDVQFASLKKDRGVFAFNNGIYMAHTDTFVQFGEGIPSPRPVACKYFDAPFDASFGAVADWFAIPTPHFQSILDFQEFDEGVCRWMYVMIGRLMYKLGDRDRWQVIPYLKGQASSGKSTILLRVCRNLYDRSDVGVLSNNIEKKFGIGAFHDKFVFVAPEIKSDLQMEQAEFQSMVSGEDMSVCIKYQTAQAVEWSVPGIFAGNEVPAWVDNSGSITRRIVLFDFQKRVDNGDMNLGKKLEAEMPNLIQKCNKAYLSAVQTCASDNVWKHLPPYFHSTREELGESTNVLEHFLKSNALRFGSELYVPWNDFLGAFQAHVRSHNFKCVHNFTKDYYSSAFIRYAIRKSNKESRPYRGGVHARVWLDGADLAENEAMGQF